MNRKRIFFVIAVLVVLAGVWLGAARHWDRGRGYVNQPMTILEDVALWSHRGEYHRLRYHSDAKAIVLVSYGVGCPIARFAVSLLQEIQEKYKNEDVVFAFFDPIPEDDRKILLQEAKDYNIQIPILMDPAQTLAKSLGITRTAEAVVVDPRTWGVVYRGKIDDRLDYEFQRKKPDHTYLADAIEAVVNGKKIKVQKTEPKGCLINYYEDPKDITYAGDVAHILAENCVRCHNSSGIAPFSMTRYKTIKKWSSMIREVVRTKRMPPREVDGHYGDTVRETAMTSEEVSKLLAWIESGMPRGEGEDPLPAAERQESSKGWPFGEPDIIIRAGTTRTFPANKFYDWTFENKSDYVFPEDMWAKAIVVKNWWEEDGNKKIVHHTSAWTDVLDDRQTHSVRYPTIKHLEMVAYDNPGIEQLPYPEGTGKLLPRGSSITFLSHYLTTGKPETFTPEIGIYLHKDPEKKVMPLVHKIIEKNDFRVPPGKRSHELLIDYRLDEDIVLYGAGPHMHYRGRSAKLVVEYPDGETETLLSVPHYDYDWSAMEYRFKTPKRIPANSVLTFRMILDNSPQNEKNPDPSRPGVFGINRTAEMVWGILVYTVEGGALGKKSENVL